MAYQIVWSPTALDDLHAIVTFIANDSAEHAMSFGYELIATAEQLRIFPEQGRVVREYRDNNLREILPALQNCLSRRS